jgi:hypothetical protein
MTSAAKIPWMLLLAIVVQHPTTTPSAAGDSLVTNGNFETWEGAVPVGWKVEVGARNGGDRPASEVKRIAGPALMLRGDAATKAWHTVTQILDIKAGQSCRLEFLVRSKEIKREPGQFDNCYVALISIEESGKVVGRAVKDISEGTDDWTSFVVDYTVPDGADQTSVVIFLSKSGLIGVKGVKAELSESPADAPGNRPENLVRNGQLSQWQDGLPVSWTAEVSARNGADRPESEIKPLEKAGVVLSGNARTLAWRSLGQDVVLKPKQSYRLTFQATAEGVKQEGRQFNNCYIGVMHFDAGGKRLDMAIKDLSQSRGPSTQAIRFTTPATTAKSTLLLFLSKSGSLKIKDVSLEEAAPEKPFR